MRRFFANARGDTIVEVLIAILVLALVLTGAFASSEQSLNNITEAGQRTKALDVAQGQIEALRADAATSAFSGPAGYNSTNSCYNTTTDSFASYSVANCTTPDGYTSEISPISITPNPSAPNLSTYEITVSYSSSANHTSNNRVTLFYTVATS